MADMMRIGGRTPEGIARAVQVDNDGYVRTKPSDNVVILAQTTTNTLVAGGETITLLERTDVKEFKEIVVVAGWSGATDTTIRTFFTTGSLTTQLDVQADNDYGSSMKQVVKVITDTVRNITLTNASTGHDLNLEKAVVYGLRR